MRPYNESNAFLTPGVGTVVPAAARSDEPVVARAATRSRYARRSSMCATAS